MITYTKVYCYENNKKLKSREATTQEYREYYDQRETVHAAKEALKYAKKLYKESIKDCDHKFFYDEDDGYMYYHRHCAVCNEFLGLI